MENLKKERDYYRQQSNELGARILSLLEEQTRAHQAVRRSKAIAELVREVYRQTDATVSLEEIGQRFLFVILKTLHVDRAALLEYSLPENHFVIRHCLGFSNKEISVFLPPSLPETFLFANSRIARSPMLDGLSQVAGGTYLLWAFQPKAGLALLISNSSEDQHLHRSFEADDREIIEGVLDIFIEISERKKAENLAALSRLALRLSEAGPDVDILNLIAEELKLLTGALAASICTYDPETRTLVVKHVASDSRTMDVLKKYFPKDLLGMSIPVSPEYLERMLSDVISDLSGFSDATLGLVSEKDALALQKELGIGEIKGLALRYGGELVGVSAVLLPQRNVPPSDELIKIFVHIASVALMRKKAEAALRESEILYRTLVENFPNGVVLMFDSNLRHTIAGGAAMKDFGLSREIQGKTVAESFPPEISILLSPQYQAVLSGKASVFEMQFGNFICEMRFTPVRNEYGQVTAGIVMIQNITDRKRAEEALWRAYDEMEKRVRERTEELNTMNAALQKENTDRKRAEEQLTASLKEKEVLLRELYHRTKNNMQVIRSMLALQAYSSRNDEVKKIIRETENRINTMALVHQKLYQSQNLSSIDLNEYIHELAHLLMQSYGVLSKRISLVQELETVHVLIDTAIPCGLILNELLSNSLKHAFPGERKGEIHIRLSKTDHETISLDFSDDGVGVPKGFDLRNQGTIGLQTIFTIVEHQLQGEAKFEIQNGLAFHIRFKDSLYTTRI